MESRARKGGPFRRCAEGIALGTLLWGVLGMFGGVAHALSYTGTYPGSGATVVGSVGAISATEYGYFWSVSRGDSVVDSYSGTGLDSVTGLDLDIDVTFNNMISDAMTDWDVRVNGVSVGSWSIGAGDGTPTLSESFSFAEIAGAGTYEIGMYVVNEVPSGDGSIAIGLNSAFTLYGTAVPEPATVLLMGSGLVGLFLWDRRRRTA